MTLVILKHDVSQMYAPTSNSTVERLFWLIHDETLPYRFDPIFANDFWVGDRRKFPDATQGDRASSPNPSGADGADSTKDSGG
jgi:hypothetical protein